MSPIKFVHLLQWSIALALATSGSAILEMNALIYAQADVDSEGIAPAVERLNSTVPAEWKKSEATLSALMKLPAERERATCALALFHIKRANTEAIAKFARQADRLFPQPSPDLKAQLLRLLLWHDLATENAERAKLHLTQLVESTAHQEVSQANKLANALMLGRVIGVLECDAAASPIDSNQLDRCKTTLNQLEPKQVSHAFSAHYNQSTAHCAELVAWFRSHAQQSITEMEQSATVELAELSTARNSLDEDLKLVRQDKHDLDSQQHQLKLEKIRVTSKTNSVVATWRKHPELHNPQQPNRNDIRVPTTTLEPDGEKRVKKYKTVIDKDGVARREDDGYEYEKKYKTVERSQKDIDRDIDRIFIPLQMRYNQLMAVRQSVLGQKADLDGKMQDVVAKLSEVGSEIKAIGELIRTQAKDIHELQEKIRVVEAVKIACKTSRPVAAYRPPIFQLVDYSAEIKVLSK